MLLLTATFILYPGDSRTWPNWRYRCLSFLATTHLCFPFIWSWLEAVSLSDVWHSYWKILFSSRANRHWMLDNIRRRQATLLADNCIRRSRSVIQVMTGCILPAYTKRASLPIRGWWSARQTDDSHINRGAPIENKNRVSQVMLHSKRPG